MTIALVFTMLLAALDSQVVLDRYAAHLVNTTDPKILVFTYAVSQAGPPDIDQTHRIYREGTLVRDETLAVDGRPLKIKTTRISSYRNRYTLHNLAPRAAQYAFLFLRTVRATGHLQYVYEAVPLGPAAPFRVDRLTIDGRTFLPSEIGFRSTAEGVMAFGTLSFAQFGKYWLPVSVIVRANVAGKSARERISFSNYFFPQSLPTSTFKSPRPLPSAVLPAY